MSDSDLLQIKLAELMRTLLVNDFMPETIRRVSPELALLEVNKSDSLGVPVNYIILLSTEKPTRSALSLLDKAASAKSARAIILSPEAPPGNTTWYHPDRFYQILGGPVTTGLILAPDLPEQLETLGRNSLPDGLNGNPNDLFEGYVKECLQFLLNSRAWRYGQDRLFEKMPDGLIFGKNDLLLLFDAKAYHKGFTVSADDVRRFTTYVKDFSEKYGGSLPRVYSFLIVSSEFKQGEPALTTKSNEMYARCQTKLSFLRAKELGEIVELMKENISLRDSVDWKLVFSNVMIRRTAVETQLQALEKDSLL
jgi:FokI, cleavage domain